MSETKSVDAFTAWVEANGSARLRRCAAEGVECQGVFCDEWIAKERPGWAYPSDLPGKYRDPVNPPMEAFDLLDKAREVEPRATLWSWEVSNDAESIANGGNRYLWTGYLAGVEVTLPNCRGGQTRYDIVYGYSGPPGA